MPSHVLGRLKWHEGVAEELYDLLRQFLHYSYWPSAWNELLVVPVLKRGKLLDDPASYRPIHLLCMLAKLMASIIDAKLQDWIPRSPEQFGLKVLARTGDPGLHPHGGAHLRAVWAPAGGATRCFRGF